MKERRIDCFRHVIADRKIRIRGRKSVRIAFNALTKRRTTVRDLAFSGKCSGQRNGSPIETVLGGNAEFFFDRERFVLRQARRCPKIRNDPENVFWGLYIRNGLSRLLAEAPRQADKKRSSQPKHTAKSWSHAQSSAVLVRIPETLSGLQNYCEFPALAGPALGAAVLRDPGRVITDIEVGRFEFLLSVYFRSQTTFEHAADEQRAFDRVRRDAGCEQFLDFAHQTRRVRYVRYGRKEELSRYVIAGALQASRKSIVFDGAFHHK